HEEVLTKTKTLLELKIVRQEKGRYIVAEDGLHLSATSPIFNAYRKLLLLKCNEQLDKLAPEKKYSFSVSFSTTPQIRQEIQEAFLSFLKTVQKRVQKGAETEVYQMNFDLFTWSEV